MTRNRPPWQDEEYVLANYDPADDTIGTGTKVECSPEARALIAEVGARVHRLQQEQARIHQEDLARLQQEQARIHQEDLARLQQERETREEAIGPRQWAWEDVRDRWAG